MAGALLLSLSGLSIAHAAPCKLPKSYYKNVSCAGNSGYFLAVKDFGEPVALIDSKGKMVTNLSSYQKADGSHLSEGLLPVLSKGRVGYVDTQGREVIPTIYDMLSSGKNWARPVSEGRLVVKKNGQFGVINTSNQTIVPFSSAITHIENYSNGRARIRRNKAVSWVDNNGNPIVENTAPLKNTPKNIPQDIAPKPTIQNTTINKNANPNINASATTTRQGKTEAVIPEPPTFPIPMQGPIVEGKTSSLVAHQSPQVMLPLPQGFTTLQPQQRDGKWGFVDDREVVMITHSFDEVRPFSEGLAGVRIGHNWGFLNLGGELIIPFEFKNDTVMTHNGVPDNSTFVFKNGRAWVNSLANGIKMCIDTQGKYIGCD